MPAEFHPLFCFAGNEEEVVQRMAIVKNMKKRKPIKDGSFCSDSGKPKPRKAKVKAIEFQTKLLSSKGKGVSSDAGPSSSTIKVYVFLSVG